jgi:ATP-binding cassette subfamily F protein uup
MAPYGDSVVLDGRSIHVASWAKRFLFRTDQLQTPVGRLSGGEQARAVLARLMLEPADLLLLDEPTNDLDIPTLEVLEERLLEFPGALVLVTHDRYLLDRVSTRILALDGGGEAIGYADYDQWEQERRRAARTAQGAAGRPRKAQDGPEAPRARPRRLGYLDQREWDGMEARILEAETRLEARRQAMEDPAVAADHMAVQERHDALTAAQAEVDRLYARWAELEARLKP